MTERVALDATTITEMSSQILFLRGQILSISAEIGAAGTRMPVCAKLLFNTTGLTSAWHGCAFVLNTRANVYHPPSDPTMLRLAPGYGRVTEGACAGRLERAAEDLRRISELRLRIKDKNSMATASMAAVPRAILDLTAAMMTDWQTFFQWHSSF